jgi:hypothetical protein
MKKNYWGIFGTIIFLLLLGGMAWWTRGMLEGKLSLPGGDPAISVRGNEIRSMLDSKAFKDLRILSTEVTPPSSIGNSNPFSRLTNEREQ